MDPVSFIFTALPIAISTADLYLNFRKTRRLDEIRARYEIRRTSGEKWKLTAEEERLIGLLDYATDLLPHIRDQIVRRYILVMVALLICVLLPGTLALAGVPSTLSMSGSFFLTLGVQLLLSVGSISGLQSTPEMKFLKNYSGIMNVLYKRRIRPLVETFNLACESEEAIVTQVRKSDDEFNEFLKRLVAKLPVPDDVERERSRLPGPATDISPQRPDPE